jgi:ERCC4-type nuclease
MRLLVDTREASLLACLDKLQCPHEPRSLVLGDAVIINSAGDVVVIAERKTVADLAASISDGRYEEQSTRLTQAEIPNHHVFYVVEGNIDTHVPRGRITRSAIKSSIISLSYYKGFSVMPTASTHKTAEFLSTLRAKLEKGEKEGRTPYALTRPDAQESYSCLQQRTKPKVLPEEIQVAMLSQIPGVSTTMARAALSTCSFRELLGPERERLSSSVYTTTTGKTRRIPRSVVENLEEYLSTI